jgi:hypothetical protein
MKKNTTQTNSPKEASMSTQFHCPITEDCEGIVAVDTGDFNATQVTIDLCPVCQTGLAKIGGLSYQVPKSALFRMEQYEATEPTMVRHSRGLVTFGGQA